jgi:acetyltransferase-like isoleucine patch superfamily enzyme
MSSIVRLLLHTWYKGRYGFAEFGAGSIIKPPARTIAGGRYISIGENCYFGEHLTLVAVDSFNGERYDPRCTIGDNCAFGSANVISCTRSISIGSDVVTSSRVFIGDSYHGYEDISVPVGRQPMRGHASVVIGDGCFLGIGAAVLHGVRLGRHCYVGANAVVTRSFDDYTVIVGNPARAIRKYDAQSKSWVSVE